ncbi:MAG TPA: hypothetical protein VIA10_09240 [Gaiellaceae bacterium]|jgi:hypothetical protein
MLVELAVALALTAPGSRTVPCAESIAETRFPSTPGRLALDAAVVPPAHLTQSTPTESRPWTHFSKWGLVLRGGAGETVTVTVPVAWRARVAISWGNAGAVYHTLRFPRCAADPTRGHAFAGGFFLRRAADCVPLRFRVGTRTQLVWFGIVRRCR